jgi:hypothetical protein
MTQPSREAAAQQGGISLERHAATRGRMLAAGGQDSSSRSRTGDPDLKFAETELLFRNRVGSARTKAIRQFVDTNLGF